MAITCITGSPASGMTYSSTPPAENDDAPRVPPGADSGQGVCAPYSVVYCTQPELGLHGASHVIPVATSREVGDLVHKLLSQGFGPLSVGVA